MKIAIQGHSTRGKEVIQILESLGGENKFELFGNCKNGYYIIKANKDIDNVSKHIISPDYKFYTLEEFEKEFPFKIGNIVALNGINKPHEIVALEFYVNKLCYKLDNGFHFSPRALIIYKEMKEERNITLTLEKAKEWYKKGGELKEIALQAFSEKELTKVELPKTWEEFCENFPVKKGECFFEPDGEICVTSRDDSKRTTKDWIPSKKSAKAHLAMIQLEQLRDCWRQGNIPREFKYKIRKVENKHMIIYGIEDSFLSFCDRQTAEEFLKCFRDLIEKAGDLI